MRHEAGAEGAGSREEVSRAVPASPSTQGGQGALLLSVLLSVLGAAACASVSPERGHDQVSTLVQQRTGYRTRWEKGPPDDARIASWVADLAKGGLTRARAVEIALVNSPTL